MDGKLIIFSAPSGAGKTTIVQHLVSKFPTIEFSVSACSRELRKGEMDGVDYYFIGVPEFKKRIEKDEFVEWEEVYENHFYGTLRSEIKRIWDRGHHVIFDVDVVGGLNLKKQFGAKALAVFVKAPSIKHLEDRLKKRDTETHESIARRIGKAEKEMEYATQFDAVLINDSMELAFIEASKLVETFLRS